MDKSLQKTKISITGVIFTAIVTLGFIWAALQWVNRYNWPRELSVGDIRSNEIQAFKNLRLIARAQEKYKQADWDADGKKNYAKFFVHLWTCINTKSEPILIKLIPKELAFAMGSPRATDGYYFVDLFRRELPEEGQTGKYDYEKEWAIAGAPASYGKTGFVIFIADNSGDIFVKNQKRVPSKYPHNPISNGWTKIENLKQLKEFRKTLNKTN